MYEEDTGVKAAEEAAAMIKRLATRVRQLELVTDDMEADARRYQWLKSTNEVALCAVAWSVPAACEHETADSAVDAAMSSNAALSGAGPEDPPKTAAPSPASDLNA